MKDEQSGVSNGRVPAFMRVEGRLIQGRSFPVIDLVPIHAVIMRGFAIPSSAAVILLANNTDGGC